MAQIDRFNGLTGDVAVKIPCRVRSTANLTLSGGQTIDGVAIVDGDRVLVMDQTTTSENGIYVASTGAWSRAPDLDGVRDITDGTLVALARGTLYAGYVYRAVVTDPITVGTSAITFTNALVSPEPASATHLSSSKTPPVDADEIPLIDSAASFGLKKLTWANLVAALQTALPPASTGDVKLTLKSTADSGWVMMDDKTIGNATSGATGRANADTAALFALLWTNISDTYCAVSTGRGASAAADYAANKTIALPKTLGRALGISGAGSGLTARALGEILGEETHALTEAENGTHTHTQTAHAHDIAGTSWQNFQGGASSDALSRVVSGPNVSTASVAAVNQNSGSGTAHNNMQPTSFVNAMVKL